MGKGGWFNKPNWDPKMFLSMLSENTKLEADFIALRDRYPNVMDSNVNAKPGIIRGPNFDHVAVQETIKVCYVKEDAGIRRGALVLGRPEKLPNFVEWREGVDNEFGCVKCDIYDALVGRLVGDGFDVVPSTLQNAFKSIDKNLTLGGSIVVWPNWIFAFLKTRDSLVHEDVLKFVERLRKYERDHKCRLFPAIDDVMFFSSKFRYLELARAKIETTRGDYNFKIIPTIEVSGNGWGKCVVEFAKKHSTRELVFKRSFSGECRDVHDVKITAAGKVSWLYV